MTPEQLAALQRANGSLRALLELGAEIGVPPAEILAILDVPWNPDGIGALEDWDDDDELEVLVEHLGGDVGRAQAVVSAAGWPLDVAGHVARRAAAGRAWTLVHEGAPARQVLEHVARHGLDPSFARALAYGRPLDDVLAAWALFPPDDLREVLLKRFTLAALGDTVVTSLPHGDAEAVLRILEPKVEPVLGEPVERLRARIAFTRRGLGSLWDVVPWAEVRHPLAEWLPVLVEAGFQPSFAALACLERGLDVAATAERLLAAGVPADEVLDALAECGAGPQRGLRALHDAGWSPSALVATARGAGHMDHEVREMLRSLRIPDADVAALLTTDLKGRGA